MAALEPAVSTDPLITGSGAAAEGPGLRARDEAGPGLYLHVPFCATRCTYCDFSTGGVTRDAMERFLGGIEREIALRAPSAAGVRFRSVFLGGGTPSALSSRQFRRVWTALRARIEIDPAAEITIEANPESIRATLLDTWRAAGVNRLSIGAQSFVPEELQALGRIHDRDRIGSALALARGAGFDTLSLDLMFGFPGHTIDRWQHTIDAALALDTDHLSAYAFIPEPGTPLGNRVLRSEIAMASEAAQAELYAVLDERAAAHGLGCYEVSNWSRPDRESRHNLGYWLRRPYLAFGPGAHGHWDGQRYGNHYAIERWSRALESGAAPEAAREPVDDTETSTEMLMLGLRLATGLRMSDYPPADATAFRTRYGAVLAEAVARGRLEATADGWRVRREHRLLADDVIAWIEGRVARGLTAGRSAA